MNSYLNISTASNGGQTPYSGSLNGTQGSNGNGYSSPDYLSPYPFRPQLAIIFKDPRTFYSNHTSDLQFPARAGQAAASLNNMLTQVNIRNWFLEPAPSGLQSYMIATVNDAARCTEIGKLTCLCHRPQPRQHPLSHARRLHIHFESFHRRSSCQIG